jgi:hypothetical protein
MINDPQMANTCPSQKQPHHRPQTTAAYDNDTRTTQTTLPRKVNLGQ